MRRYGTLLLVLVLATASLLAAAAYNTATVTNAASLKVVNTDQALLTLEAHPPWYWQSKGGQKDNTATVVGGELYFEFGKGVGRDGTTPVFYGLQPNSVYEWIPLFTIRNKSAETLDITISATGPFAQYITFGSCSQAQATQVPAVASWGTMGSSYTFTSVPKETGSGMQNIRNVAVMLSIPTGHPVSVTALLGSIVVTAHALQP